jgi:hypothetical protein
MKAKNIYAWMRFVVTLALLALLLLSVVIWVPYGSAAQVMSQVGLQRAREQHMLKDILVLSYRSQTTERSVALSELQDTLPLWEQTQQGLQSGNKALGLPKHPPSDVALQLTQTQSDYTPIDVALRKIEALPQHPDAAQTQIVMDHERAYFVDMSNVDTLWQGHIDEIFLQLFWIQASLVALVAVLVVWTFILSMRSNKGA